MYRVETQQPPALFFEDFTEGQEMPVASKGPMTAGHQVRWAGACDNYASDFHHDAAAARAQGLPGLLLSGPFMACYLLTAVTHWLGQHARVRSFADKNSGTTMPGDMAHLQARIQRLWVEGGVGRVEVVCDILNQDGKSTTPSTLVAELPRKGA